MVSTLLSFALLLIFSEFASANFKRLAPVLEAWEQSRKIPDEKSGSEVLWKGGWEKLATLVWALGTSIPLLAFASACTLFLREKNQVSNIVLGAAIGSNVIGLSLAFGLALLSGPITFFRVRTITSPVFLLLATVAFTYVCLNQVIAWTEGFILLLLLIAYGFYFRRFSSEWKYYERTFDARTLVESAEGALPLVALVCMGIGFFLLAVVSSYPLIQQLGTLVRGHDTLRLSAHLVAFALSLPWLLRSLFSIQGTDTAKAIAITGISHTCLLNLLLLPAFLAVFAPGVLAASLLTIYLPVLLFFTGTFVSSLLIEKETGGLLTWFLILSYLLYTGIGLYF